MIRFGSLLSDLETLDQISGELIQTWSPNFFAGLQFLEAKASRGLTGVIIKAEKFQNINILLDLYK